MSLFGGVIPISGVTFLLFSVMIISVLGYLLGRITVSGVSLGTAGVFIIAILFGGLFYSQLNAQLTINEVSYTKNALKIIENIGLIFFVTSVGFIAGPKFFSNMKKNFKKIIRNLTDVTAFITAEYDACYKSHKKIKLNSTYVNAVVNHALDLIDPSWNNADIPALNRIIEQR